MASWLPVLRGLMPHGLRHGLQTWMDEDGIPEVLKTERDGARDAWHARRLRPCKPRYAGRAARCAARALGDLAVQTSPAQPAFHRSCAGQASCSSALGPPVKTRRNKWIYALCGEHN